MARMLCVTTALENPVWDTSGEILGHIEDFVIDFDSGSVAYYILATGGFMGIGCKFIAIPVEDLELHRDKRHFVVAVEKSVLKNTPGLDRDEWVHENWKKTLRSLHGTTPRSGSQRVPLQ